MKHNLEPYLPFPLLLWRTITQPFHEALAWSVDLLWRERLHRDLRLRRKSFRV